MWVKQCHKPAMTGNGKLTKHIQMLMFFGDGLYLWHWFTIEISMTYPTISAKQMAILGSDPSCRQGIAPVCIPVFEPWTVGSEKKGHETHHHGDKMWIYLNIYT